MCASPDEKGKTVAGETLRGWVLGVVLPERAKRASFLPGKARCAVCGCSISDCEGHLFQTCDSRKCRAEHQRQQRVLRKEREERERQQWQEFEERLQLFRDKAARLLDVDRPERYAPAVIPAVERPVTCLPLERLSALRDRLTQRIAETREKRDATPCDRQNDDAPTLAADADSKHALIFEQACALCRGHCCFGGEDEGYLDVDTIFHYLQQHPDMETPDVLAAFLSHVPKSTCERSCVYHGQNGCGLPHDKRSGTCTGFECTGLRRLREKLPNSGPHRVLLIAMKGGRVLRYAFVHV